MENLKNRTCKPNFVGLKFISGDHYAAEFLTDEQAIYLLNKGYVKENEFDILPEGWKKIAVKEIASEVEIKTEIEVKPKKKK
jgi:hypothetical protein